MLQMKEFLTTAVRLLSTTTTGPLAGIRIWNGGVMITNSRLSYTAYIEQFKHLNVLVDARKFVAAVRGTKFDPAIRTTEKFIVVSKGKFRARIQLQDPEPYPVFAVQGHEVDIGVDRALRRIQPFISTDASRPWACGVYFDGEYVYATNNIVLVRQPLHTPHPFVLPGFAFDELLRATSELSRVTITRNAVRFIMSNGISLHSVLTENKWPDVAALIESARADTQPIPEGMKAGVEAMVPLCDNMQIPRINLHENGMSTEEGSTAAKYEEWSFPQGSFNAKPLLDVLSVADSINFAGWPGPCYFTGPGNIEGIMVGLRQ